MTYVLSLERVRVVNKNNLTYNDLVMVFMSWLIIFIFGAGFGAGAAYTYIHYFGG